MIILPPQETAPEQTFLARSLHRPDVAGARAEAIALLHSVPLADITKPETNVVWSHHRLGPAEVAAVGSRLYAEILAATAERGSFVGQAETVEHLESLLDVSTDAAATARHAKVVAYYREAFAAAVVDRIITDDRWAGLDELARRLDLSVEERASAEAPVRVALINAQVDRLIEGGEFTPQLAQALATWSAHLRALPSDMSEERRAELSTLATAWRLGNEDLPVVDVEIALQKGEVCHADSPVLWWEVRANSRYSTSYGPVMRVPIIAGLSFRVAAFKHTAINTETLQLIDSGSLYVTNKRVIFNGEKKNTTIRLNAILNVTPHGNGIVLDKSSGRSPHIQTFGGEALHLATILRRVIAQANA